MIKKIKNKTGLVLCLAFCAFCAAVLFQTPTSALSIPSEWSVVDQHTTPEYEATINDSSTCYQSAGTCSGTSISLITDRSGGGTYQFNDVTSISIKSTFNNLDFFFSDGINGWGLIGFDVYSAYADQFYNFYLTCRNESGCGHVGVPVRFVVDSSSSSVGYARMMSWVVYRNVESTDYSSSLNTLISYLQSITNTWLPDINDKITYQGYSVAWSAYYTWSALNDVDNVKLPEIISAINGINQTQTEIEQNTQNVSDYVDEQRQADSNIENQEDIGNSTDQGFENNITIIQNFNQILNTSPTNCNIDMSSLPLNLGVVNMCALPVPSFITAISSIIVIIVALPIVFMLINKILELIKEMQS